MVIEKVTFYKFGSVPYRSGDPLTNYNLTPISLPRVRWLESEGPYRPSWAIDYNPAAPIIEKPAEIREPRKRKKKCIRSGPLTEIEQTAYDLFRKGLTLAEVSHRTGYTFTRAKDAVYRARVKLGLLPQKVEVSE